MKRHPFWRLVQVAVASVILLCGVAPLTVGLLVAVPVLALTVRHGVYAPFLLWMSGFVGLAGIGCSLVEAVLAGQVQRPRWWTLAALTAGFPAATAILLGKVLTPLAWLWWPTFLTTAAAIVLVAWRPLDVSKAD